MNNGLESDTVDEPKSSPHYTSIAFDKLISKDVLTEEVKGVSKGATTNGVAILSPLDYMLPSPIIVYVDKTVMDAMHEGITFYYRDLQCYFLGTQASSDFLEYLWPSNSSEKSFFQPRRIDRDRKGIGWA